MAGGNHGLRLINNNYVPDGTGRDRLIYYDRSFRGGRECVEKYQPHFFNGPTGPGSLCQLKERDRPAMGFNHRAEGPQQVKSLSRPSVNLISSWRNQTMATATSEWEIRRHNLRAQQIESERKLLRVHSDPGLDYPREYPFQRTIGTAHCAAFFPPPPTAKSDEAAFEPKKFVRNDMERHEYPGFSRTPYGGLWKVNSFIGPG